MNNRERTMAVALIVFMVFAGGGFVAYQFIYSPWKNPHDDIARESDEVSKLESELQNIAYKESRFESETKKMSLPLDETLAQREYEQLLDQMLRKAGFTTPSITPRPHAA